MGDPQQLHECFLAWSKHLSSKLDINVISIDGKTARGSYDREKGLKALHTVSAWAAVSPGAGSPGSAKSTTQETQGATRTTRGTQLC